MSESPFIIPDQDLKPSMDFDLLRKQAIATSQSTSGKKWTDYNLHDPGVTIIEQFSFALTDIAFRTNIDIQDLLFHGDVNVPAERFGLYAPEAIFSPPPITIDDYRILFLDRFFDVLANCWLEKVTTHREGILGLYNLTIHLKSDVPVSQYPQIVDEIREYYQRYRNLAEDLEEIIILEPELLSLEIDVEISQESNAEEVVAIMLFNVESYLNPWVEFKTMEEMSELGYSFEQILDVPSREHGFVQRDLLYPKHNEYYISKIEEYISSVPGIRYLNSFRIFQDGVPVYGDIINVAASNFVTLLDPNSENLFNDGLRINVSRGGIRNKYRKESVAQLLDQLSYRQKRDYKFREPFANDQFSKVSSDDIRSYESVQFSFPSIFKVGHYSPAKEEGVVRQAQSSQLKAYLTLIDQVMANHLEQLLKIRELFSIYDFDTEKLRTYYSQSLRGSVPDAESLLITTLRPEQQILSDLERQKTYTGHSRKEATEIKYRLELELKRKRLLVNELAIKERENLLKLDEDNLIRNKRFRDLKIYDGLLDLKRKRIQDQESNQSDKVKALETKVTELISFQLLNETQEVDMSDQDLRAIISIGDRHLERKNRVLSHMLARFGERFSTDFFLRYNHESEGKETDEAEMHIIELKALLLRQIIQINRYRSRGVQISTAVPFDDKITELEKKVSLLLDINKKSNSRASMDEAFNVERLTSTELQRQKSKASRIEFISKKNPPKKGFVEFVINSPHYMKYLFQFGLAKSNYQIMEEGNNHVVYFIPPTNEDATRLFVAKSHEEAQSKIAGLLKKLQKYSQSHEHFYILEHILLRGHSSSFCNFYLIDKDGRQLYISAAMRKEDQQSLAAMDVLLLACYAENYSIEKSENGDYIVLIKSSDGVILSQSCDLFLTQLSAENFIKTSVALFRKGKGDYTAFYDLDNRSRYDFEILDELDGVLFESDQCLEMDVQEQRVKLLLRAAIEADSYEISEERKTHLFRVILKVANGSGSASSSQLFRTAQEAERFIQQCVRDFKRWSEPPVRDGLVRYTREGGVSAKLYNSVVSIVYPEWTARFSNQEFFNLFKQTVHRCAPAHLSLRFVGLDYKDMDEFSGRYQQLMEELGTVNHQNRNRIASFTSSLLKLLTYGSIKG